MNKYQEAEKELAELLGWTNIETGYKFCTVYVHCLLGDNPNHKYFKGIPRWCSDDAEAFKLMVEHDCYPDCNDDDVMASHSRCMSADLFTPAYTLISEHPDKFTAFRYAIVQAVIAKLKSTA